MNENGFALDYLRFESLNRQAMQSGRAVQQHRMPLGHFFKNVPDLRRLALNHLFRAAHCVHVTEVFQPADNEWLEKHERHLLWQTALVQLQLRTNDNHRAASVIDAFTQEVLAKTAALALEHVAKRFDRPVASVRHGATMSAVIEQSVHRF